MSLGIDSILPVYCALAWGLVTRHLTSLDLVVYVRIRAGRQRRYFRRLQDRQHQRMAERAATGETCPKSVLFRDH
jgi:hypothetical protein